jgi:hypothetical protein
VAIAVGVVVILGGVIALRRAHRTSRVDHLERESRRPLASVPSPHHPSRAVRLLEPGEQPEPGSAHVPLRPSLPTDRPYVFTDSASDGAPIVTRRARSRHSDDWALERAGHRARMVPGSMGVIAAVVAALVALIVAGTLLHHSPSSTTTTTVNSTTLPGH